MAAPLSAQVVTDEPTRLELRAPAGCSSVEDFTARVARRSSRIRFVPDSARRSLLVELVSTGRSLRGSVTLVEADGATRTRKLTASSCEDAAEGLALIATVTLDPDALLAEPEPEPEPEAAPEPAPRPPAVSRPAAPKRDETPQVGPALTDEPSARVSLGLAVTLMAEVAPEIAPGGSVEVALELFPGRVLAPFFRLSVPHAQRRGLERGGGTANFAYTLPTLDVCPVRLGSRALGLRPCAYGSVGLLKAWGSSTDLENLAHKRLFASAGGALWLGLKLSKTIEIIADARGIVPLERDSFAFDDVVFWKTPPLGFSSVIGVAGGFP